MSEKIKVSFRIADYPNIDPNIHYYKTDLEREGYTLVPIFKDTQYKVVYSDVAKTYGVPMSLIVREYDFDKIKRHYNCNGPVQFRGERQTGYAFTDKNGSTGIAKSKVFVFSDNYGDISIDENEIGKFCTEKVRDYYVLQEREIESRVYDKRVITALENSFKEERGLVLNNYSYIHFALTQVSILEGKDISLELMHHFSHTEPSIYVVY